MFDCFNKQLGSGKLKMYLSQVKLTLTNVFVVWTLATASVLSVCLNATRANVRSGNKFVTGQLSKMTQEKVPQADS